jgi:hypothetical protein
MRGEIEETTLSFEQFINERRQRSFASLFTIVNGANVFCFLSSLPLPPPA